MCSVHIIQGQGVLATPTKTTNKKSFQKSLLFSENAHKVSLSLIHEKCFLNVSFWKIMYLMPLLKRSRGGGDIDTPWDPRGVGQPCVTYPGA